MLSRFNIKSNAHPRISSGVIKSEAYKLKESFEDFLKFLRTDLNILNKYLKHYDLSFVFCIFITDWLNSSFSLHKNDPSNIHFIISFDNTELSLLYLSLKDELYALELTKEVKPLYMFLYI